MCTLLERRKWRLETLQLGMRYSFAAIFPEPSLLASQPTGNPIL